MSKRGKKYLKGEEECDQKENKDEKKSFFRARNNMIRHSIKFNFHGTAQRPQRNKDEKLSADQLLATAVHQFLEIMFTAASGSQGIMLGTRSERLT